MLFNCLYWRALNERLSFQPLSVPGPLWKWILKVLPTKHLPLEALLITTQPWGRDLARDLNCPLPSPPLGHLLFIPQYTAVFSQLPGRLLPGQACLWCLLWAPPASLLPSVTAETTQKNHPTNWGQSIQFKTLLLFYWVTLGRFLNLSEFSFLVYKTRR